MSSTFEGCFFPYVSEMTLSLLEKRRVSEATAGGADAISRCHSGVMEGDEKCPPETQQVRAPLSTLRHIIGAPVNPPENVSGTAGGLRDNCRPLCQR